ncbi:unnamed protein product [Prorocentrum cordatum]|uniref:Uncharacterized protein n=1 Tax=Prorocentrum cordatum TaxID=2364126 RepID=A0ABN9WWD5_9DINO|nr:unnamed protein product [Polarella glacialis]
MIASGQSGAPSNRDEPQRVSQATPAAADPEAATDGLAMEHVMSGFGQSGALRSRSVWSPALSHMSSVRSNRSKERARFLKRVGRTETEESLLEMDWSLAVHDAELLRAVPASAIIGCVSHTVMSSSPGCEATFALSRPVMRMHYFVSHSWQTPAWLKLVCLMYEMNAGRAVVAALATQIVIVVLQTAGLWDPHFLSQGGLHYVDDQRIHVVPFEAHWLISCSVFFLVLCWGQVIPVRESLCFLDKCCINQTDSIKKAAGIKQLGAFLRNSENLLVL